MPFRDDEDARLARLAGLESENARLREKLQEALRASEKLLAEREQLAREKSKKAEPAPKAATRKRRASASAEDAEPKRGTESGSAPPAKRTGWLRYVLVAVVLAVAFVAIPYAIDKATTRTVTGLAYVDGVLSVKITSTRKKRFGSTSTRQLASFDLATGKRLGSVEIGNATFAYPESGTRVWARVGIDKLALIDVRTPAIVVPSDQLARRIPELAAGFKLSDGSSYTIGDGSVAGYETRSSDALAIVLADGSRAWLTPEPRLSRTPPPAPSSRDPVGYSCDGYDARSCERQQCFTWVNSKDTTTLRLGWRLPQQDKATPSGTNPAALHAPRFVQRLDRHCALEIDGGVLVRHASSAVEPNHRLLSLLAADGTLRWTRRVDELAGSQGMPVAALLADDRIHLLLVQTWSNENIHLDRFNSSRLVLVHLSATTGETLATHRLL